MERKARLFIDWPNVAIVIGAVGTISGLSLLFGL
jgi:hypothetical protein